MLIMHCVLIKCLVLSLWQDGEWSGEEGTPIFECANLTLRQLSVSVMSSVSWLQWLTTSC